MKPAQRQKSIDNNVPSLERLKDSSREHSVAEQPYSTHTSAWRRQPIVNIKRRSDKEDIQMEIEYNMKCIQKQATLFCHINEEWMTLKDELAVVKKKIRWGIAIQAGRDPKHQYQSKHLTKGIPESRAADQHRGLPSRAAKMGDRRPPSGHRPLHPTQKKLQHP
jgi:hypothetical protein